MDTSNDSYQQNYPKMDDPDETEDTLSLCDLPIYTTPADWKSFSEERRNSSPEHDFFEFYSQEFSGSIASTASSSTTSSQPDTIMFCGKLIPYKQDEQVQPISISKSAGKSSTKKRGFLTRWGSDSSRKLKNGSGDSKLSGSNSTRWYLFMFGLSRFPVMEMDLRDMKRRQSRRVPEALVRSDVGGEVVGISRNRGKGLWGMIRYLGCVGGEQANDVVKVSFGCMPRV